MLTVPEHERWSDILAHPLPRHVGFILDGNGRWAAARGLTRVEGHQAGAAAFADTCRFAATLRLANLSMFTFALTNFERDREEVAFMMQFGNWLLTPDLVDELRSLGAGIRFEGNLNDPRIPVDTRQYIADVEAQSTGPTNITLLFAYNNQTPTTSPPRVNVPDVDLVVRTGGEQRLSGFLPQETMHAELIFTDTLWPDFRRGQFIAALEVYHRRARRLGRESSVRRASEDLGIDRS